MNKDDFPSDSESDEDFCPYIKTSIQYKSDNDSKDDSGSEDDLDFKAVNKSSAKKITRSSSNHSNKLYKQTITEKVELESDEDEKSRKDALWADFLSDSSNNHAKATDSLSKSRKSTEIRGELSVVKNATSMKIDSHLKLQLEENVHNPPEETKSLPVETVEDSRLCKTISVDSKKENKSATKSSFVLGTDLRSFNGKRRPEAGISRNFDSIFQQMGKKKKVSVLEKSKHDWNTFKTDEGIQEELQSYNKGKDGYLERRDFLERTDLRQFEIEKTLRQTRRKN